MNAFLLLVFFFAPPAWAHTCSSSSERVVGWEDPAKRMKLCVESGEVAVFRMKSDRVWISEFSEASVEWGDGPERRMEIDAQEAGALEFHQGRARIFRSTWDDEGSGLLRVDEMREVSCDSSACKSSPLKLRGCKLWAELSSASDVRASASSRGKSVERLPSKTRVLLIERRGDWAKVASPREGWVRVSALKLPRGDGKREALKQQCR